MSILHAAVPRRWVLYLTTLAVAAAAVFGVVQARPAEAREAPPMTATEIADGVLFNTGPAAEYLTGLNRGETPWTEDLRDIQERVHFMFQKDPRYARSFQVQMQSGDPRLIDAAMTGLGERVRDILYKKYEPAVVDETLRKIELEWVEEQIIRGAIVDAEFASYEGSDVWLVTDVAVAAVVAAVVAVAVFWVLKEITSEHTDLAQEIILNEIAVGLEAGL